MPGPRFPEFYIIGAPKCGTTALYTYLGEHPSVFMPQMKEPHYFATDYVDFPRVADLDSYLALFKDAPPTSLWGEASVWYLYSHEAVANIIKARPDAKIFVMLRNPADAVEALHAQLLVNFMENIYDLEEAWRAQDDRMAGKRVPLHCTVVDHVLYGQAFSYAHQLKRLFSIVPRDQVRVLIYEELFANPEPIFAEVQKFLGLKVIARAEFERINPSRRPQNLLVHHLLAKPPYPLNLILAALRRVSRKYGLHLGVPLMRIAVKLAKIQPAKRPAMRPEFRKELYEFFSKDISEVEQILGRPLRSWWSS